MKYFDVTIKKTLIFSDPIYNHYNCRCVDSMTKDDVQRYFEKIWSDVYYIREDPDGAKAGRFFLDCDTEEKAEKARNITFWQAQGVQFKEEFKEDLPIYIIILFIFAPLMLLFLGVLPYIFALIWVIGFVLAILFK